MQPLSFGQFSEIQNGERDYERLALQAMPGLEWPHIIHGSSYAMDFGIDPVSQYGLLFAGFLVLTTVTRTDL